MERGDRTTNPGFADVIDLHWRISNRWRLIVGCRYMDVDLEE